MPDAKSGTEEPAGNFGCKPVNPTEEENLPPGFQRFVSAAQ
jgi:hypothetical protein